MKKLLKALECVAKRSPSLYDRTEQSLKDAIFKILCDHLEEREQKITSTELEFVNDKPAVKFEGGYVFVDSDTDLYVVEEYD